MPVGQFRGEPTVLVTSGEHYGAVIDVDFDYRAHAIYVVGPGLVELTLELPSGTFRAEWINTLNGSLDREKSFTHDGGPRQLPSPDFAGDIALRIEAE